MSRTAPGFVGNLIGFAPLGSGGLLTATAILPRQDLDAFHGTIGLPPVGFDPVQETDAYPALALIPVVPPRHPQRATDALADGALRCLEELLAAGELRFDLRRARRVEALARAVPFQPLRVAVDRP